MFTENLCLVESSVSLEKGERNGILSAMVIYIGSITQSDFTNFVSSFSMASIAFLVSSNKWED